MLCHKAVRNIAKELAGAAYEDLAKNDLFYKQYPNQNLFIAKFWKTFLGPARQSLLYMLEKDYPEAMKEDILEIYIRDRMLQDVKIGNVAGSA